MACFHPIDAWQLETGEVIFVERGKVLRSLRLPCGRCIGCRQVRVRSWALRCMHESQMHDVSSFITLTYDDDHWKPGLVYRDFQRFMYRLRKRLGPTRFFMCGEYGGQTLRPHFHALLFGQGFPDREPLSSTLYRSRTLEDLWRFGFSSVGDVSMQSAGYVARYALKKVSGDRAAAHYERLDTRTGEIVSVVPEFGHMSLKPGIGFSWFAKYWQDVFAARDGVVVKGRVVPSPRYYCRLLESIDPDRVDELEFERYVKSGLISADTTRERLATRELCALARERSRKERSL